jgi:hypothetical protein
MPAFESLRSKEPAKLPAPDATGKKFFWGGWVLLGLISFGTAVLTLYIYPLLPFFNAPRLGIPRVFFAAPTSNVVMTWAVMNGIAGMLWYWLVVKKRNDKAGVTDEQIGWKMDKVSWFKTAGLAIAIIFIVYTIISLARWGFMTDFRFWTPALKTFRVDKLVTLIPYLPFFFLFYLANSLLINGALRVDGMNEKKNIFICALGNILGCGTLFLVQYVPMLLSPNNLQTWGPQWISALVINFLIPQLFVAGYLNRYFFKATGKVWLGAMVNTMIFVMIGIMHNCITGIFV